MEFNIAHNRYEVVKLYDDGFHFDVEINDGIYGNFIIADLKDYRTEDLTIVYRFDPDTIFLIERGHYPPVRNIPSPPVILSPTHQGVISSAEPLLCIKISEDADGYGIALFDQKPILGKYGNILWKGYYEKVDDLIIEKRIPVSLRNNCEYHLIVFSYIKTKAETGSAFAMEWVSFFLDTTAKNQNILKLEQNFPNPFNTSTVICWEQTEPAHVEINIFNILGNKVACVMKTVKPAGRHYITWDAINQKGMRVKAGTYVLKAQIGRYERAIKLLLID